MSGKETRPFYVGVSECGCVTAMLVDDDKTTPKEIGDFARRMSKSKRRMEHRTVTIDDFGRFFQPCPHKEATP
jgi:hypothetical protein